MAQLSGDTPAAVEQRQIEAWRRMSPAEKAALVTGLTQACCDLTWAGVRHRYPDATPHEQFLQFALIMLGDDLAPRVHPEIASRRLR